MRGDGMFDTNHPIGVARSFLASPRVLAIAAAVLLLLAVVSPVVVVSFSLANIASPPLDGFADWTGDMAVGSPAWWAVLAFAGSAVARFVPRIWRFRRWIDLAALALLVAAVAWALYGGPLATNLQVGNDPSDGRPAGPPVSVRPAFGCLPALLAPIALMLARRREAALPPLPPSPPTVLASGSIVAAVTGAVVGLPPIYPAIMLAIISGGMGHGHYVAARALFPIPMLLTHATGGEIGIVVMALALLQFPAYGATLGWCLAARAWRPVIVMAVTHGLATLLIFSGTLPNFD